MRSVDTDDEAHEINVSGDSFAMSDRDGGVVSVKDSVGHAISDTEPKRVKAYVLENNEWKDTGTGFCVGKFDKGAKQDNIGPTTACAYLVVNNEDSPSEVLLKSRLEGNIEYQRQEETLIVWKDLSGKDIALSFEESIGCDVLCDFIVDVQRNLESNISLVAVKSNDNGVGSVHEIITGPVALPSKEKEQNQETLMEALRILNENIAFEFLKNETIQFVLQTNYLKLLIDHFHIAEKNKLPKDLFLLGSIIKTLILYNQRDILEQMVEDDKINGIVGILEYDTEFPTLKANHRKCLESYNPSFKEVIPINNQELITIVKKCFRLQFLKDVVLVRFLDDHNFHLILDTILDLQTCILGFLQVDPCLDELMEIYNDTGNNDPSLIEKRKDGIKLLHQCVQMSKNLDPVDKSKFYKALVRKKLFKLLDYAFHVETDSGLRIMATDTIVTIIEHDILLIHNVQNENSSDREQSNEETTRQNNIFDGDGSLTPFTCKRKGSSTMDMSLLLILSTILLTDKSPGLKEQVAQALHTLLHPEGCLSSDSEYENSPSRSSNDMDVMSYNLIKDDIDDKSLNTSYFQIMDYFANFYKQVAPVIFEPLIKREAKNRKQPSNCDDNLYIHLIKLVSFISTEHDRRMSREFILENGLLESVSELIMPKHSLQLRLTAVRCFKNIMCLDDDYYHRYMMSKELYGPIFGLLQENINKDNLANSCIQDFCKLVIVNCMVSREEFSIEDPTITYKRTNFVLLNGHIVRKYGEILRQADHIKFIKDMLQYSVDQIVTEDDIDCTRDENHNLDVDEGSRPCKRSHSELIASNPDGNYEDSKAVFGHASASFKDALDKINSVEPSSGILGEIMRE